MTVIAHEWIVWLYIIGGIMLGIGAVKAVLVGKRLVEKDKIAEDEKRDTQWFEILHVWNEEARMDDTEEWNIYEDEDVVDEDAQKRINALLPEYEPQRGELPEEEAAKALESGRHRKGDKGSIHIADLLKREGR